MNYNIVSLPITIIRNILCYLDNDIDILCFLLLNKKIAYSHQKILCLSKYHFKLPEQASLDAESTALQIKANSDVDKLRDKPLFEYPAEFKEFICPGSNKNRLIFNDSFNQPLDQDNLRNLIPLSVTNLVFGDAFNQPLQPGDIPESITHLTLGKEFNQPLQPGAIPSSVTSLLFGYSFDQRLEPGHIPSSVTHLAFGDMFNQPLQPGQIPTSVTHLNFGAFFGQQLGAGHIPNSVVSLELSYHFSGQLTNIPTSVRHLTYFGSEPIPEGVTHMDFGYLFDQPLTVGHIPLTVTHLDLGFDFNRPLQVGHIPNSVTDLKLGYCFNTALEAGHIPNSVTRLTFGRFDQPLEHGHLPESLTHLDISCCHRVSFSPASVPASLTHLDIGKSFNQALPSHSIKSLKVMIQKRDDEEDIYANHINLWNSIREHRCVEEIAIENSYSSSDFNFKRFVLAKQISAIRQILKIIPTVFIISKTTTMFGQTTVKTTARMTDNGSIMLLPEKANRTTLVWSTI